MTERWLVGFSAVMLLITIAFGLAVCFTYSWNG